MKILISAYACEPHRGSEPEIGWQWVKHLSQLCDVTVVTRSNNREAIEKELSLDSYPGLSFEYVDLSSMALRLKKMVKPKSLGVLGYYILWQRAARVKIATLVKLNVYDLIHHSTLGAFRMPFAVDGHGVPCVVGPVGGCEEYPEEFLPRKHVGIYWKEKIRNTLNRLHTQWGLGMQRYKKVDRILACTDEMSEAFECWGVRAKVMPNIGMVTSDTDVHTQMRSDKKGVRMLFVGRLFYWKGLGLAMDVLSELPSNVGLTIVGDGPDRKEIEKDVCDLGLADRVHFAGSMPRSKVLEMYKEYDLFFFPSFHDSGGFVVLEAMLAGMPVICLKAGGPALTVSKNCGVVVPITSYKETVERLKKAVMSFANEEGKLFQHGLQAQKRIKNMYDWGQKSREMLEVYNELMNEKNGRREEK